MIIFKNLTLTNTSLFKSVSLDIKRGISVIYGLNKTSATSNNSNAAGKSYLASQIFETLLAVPVTGTKQDRVVRGVRQLKIKSNRKDVTVTRTNNQLKVEVEGVEPVRGVTNNLKLLQKYVPISEDEANAYMFLDSRIGHPLVKGTTAQRKSFLTSFCNLDLIDKERKLVQSKINGLKSSKAIYQELYTEYKKLTTDLKAMTGDESEIEGLEERFEKLTANQERYSEYQRQQEFLSRSAKQIRQLKTITDDLSVDNVRSLIKSMKDAIRLAEERKDEYDEYIEHQRKIDAYNKAKSAVDPELEPLLEDKNLENKAKYYLKSKQGLDTLLESEIDKPVKPVRVTDPGSSVAQIETELEKVEHKIEHQSKFKSGLCPTCGSSVKSKESASSLIQQTKRLEAKLEQAEAYQQYVQLVKKYKQDVQVYKSNRDLKITYKELIAKYEPYHRAYKLKINMPTDPGPLGKEVKLVDSSKLKLKLSILQSMVNHLDLLEPLKPVKDLGHKLSAVNQKLQDLKVQKEVKARYKQRWTELRTRLKELKLELEEEKVLADLLLAYNDKNMKKSAINLISTHIMQRINKHAKRAFPENYEFELVWDTSQISLLVHRRYGKRIETTDVRKLSGAETIIFTLILILTLLSFVPSNKRPSLLVLDEPTANLGPEMFLIFQDLLSALSTVIPSIIVVTPKTDEFYDGATNYTVIKTKGDAQLVTGHPREQTEVKIISNPKPRSKTRQ